MVLRFTNLLNLTNRYYISTSSSGNSEKIGNHGLPGTSNINQPDLFVAPLNSEPYLGPSNSTPSISTNKSKGNAEKSEPAMTFLPNHSSQEIKDLAAQTNNGVVLTGSAAMGPIGPTIGRMDIFESDDSYFFRVSLPGVSREENEFKCDIGDDGLIVIKGTTTTGEETVCRHSQVFKMLTQNLGPPGPFTISFKLPGPVNNEEFSGKLEFGVLEGKVKKVRKNSEPKV
ncbi:unnamed protein product [Arabis nemorensis]|uniref:SHSP domain-containing protein n=1 Tax=Arabis nemorensis TaxID=586526 RepID=A0A565BR84_9BRAS|nr:unnamed protein product [Arabis nemorensis]